MTTASFIITSQSCASLTQSRYYRHQWIGQDEHWHIYAREPANGLLTSNHQPNDEFLKLLQTLAIQSAEHYWFVTTLKHHESVSDFCRENFFNIVNSNRQDIPLLNHSTEIKFDTLYAIVL